MGNFFQNIQSSVGDFFGGIGRSLKESGQAALAPFFSQGFFTKKEPTGPLNLGPTTISAPKESFFNITGTPTGDTSEITIGGSPFGDSGFGNIRPITSLPPPPQGLNLGLKIDPNTGQVVPFDKTSPINNPSFSGPSQSPEQRAESERLIAESKGGISGTPGIPSPIGGSFATVGGVGAGISGATGLPGEGPAFTGRGAGGGTSAPVTSDVTQFDPNAPQEERDRIQNQNRVPNAPQPFLMFDSPQAKQLDNIGATGLYRDPRGNIYKQGDSPFGVGFVLANTPSNIATTSATTGKGVTLPSSPIDINFAAKQKAGDKLREFFSKNKNPTQSEALNFYNSSLTDAYKEESAKNPIPDNPVNPTPFQFNYERNSSDPTGERAAMDDARRRSGLPQLESDRISTMKLIQSANMAFQKIVKDIRDDPELPTSLARKRIEFFTDRNAITLQNLKGELDITNQQIKDANDLVDREFGITKDENAERRYQESKQLQQFDFLLRNGAFDQGISNSEAQKFANIVRVSSDKIKSAVATQQGKDNLTSQIKSMQLELNTARLEAATAAAGTPENINTLASNLNDKTVTLSQIPSALRAKVLARAKELREAAAKTAPKETNWWDSLLGIFGIGSGGGSAAPSGSTPSGLDSIQSQAQSILNSLNTP